MSATKEVEPYYLKRAEELMDLLVDKGFIRDDVSREETRVLEDYVGWLFQHYTQAAVRTDRLMRKHEDRNAR